MSQQHQRGIRKITHDKDQCATNRPGRKAQSVRGGLSIQSFG
jgi:hypothetical protein